MKPKARFITRTGKKMSWMNPIQELYLFIYFYYFYFFLNK